MLEKQLESLSLLKNHFVHQRRIATTIESSLRCSLRRQVMILTRCMRYSRVHFSQQRCGFEVISGEKWPRLDQLPLWMKMISGSMWTNAENLEKHSRFISLFLMKHHYGTQHYRCKLPDGSNHWDYPSTPKHHTLPTRKHYRQWFSYCKCYRSHIQCTSSTCQVWWNDRMQQETSNRRQQTHQALYQLRDTPNF